MFCFKNLNLRARDRPFTGVCHGVSWSVIVPKRSFRRRLWGVPLIGRRLVVTQTVQREQGRGTRACGPENRKRTEPRMHIDPLRYLDRCTRMGLGPILNFVEARPDGPARSSPRRHRSRRSTTSMSWKGAERVNSGVDSFDIGPVEVQLLRDPLDLAFVALAEGFGRLADFGCELGPRATLDPLLGQVCARPGSNGPWLAGASRGRPGPGWGWDRCQ